MERSRVVEVYCAASGRFGSGYLVTGGTVLTAWHLVEAADSGEFVEIRPLAVDRPPGPWFQAVVVWPAPPAAPGPLDIALLAIQDTNWDAPHLTQVLWGRIVEDWPVAVIGLGFPDAAAGGHPDTTVRDTLPLRGHIDPLAHTKSSARHVMVGLDGPLVPARATDTKAQSPWSGASGTALFAADGGILLAVATADHRLALDARTLIATPVWALTQDQGFPAVAAAHGIDIKPAQAAGTSLDHRLRRLPVASHVAVPAGVSNIGRQVFVGRVEELDELDAVMRSGASAVTQVISGLGGIGKTTLASEYAHRHRGDHTLTWSLTADSRVNAEAGMASLTRRLCPDEATGHPDAALTEWAMAWLQGHPRWLLVWDNVDDLDEILPLLYGLTGGHHLVTSRRSGGWHRIGVTKPLRLGELRPDDAVELLLVLAGPAADEDAARKLCAELGNLPLAVEQAGAYMAEAGIDAKTYLQLWHTAKDRALAKAPESLSADRIMTGVWRITLDKIADSPLAGRLLRVMAWLAPAGIPRDLLAPLSDDPDESESALRRLNAYSMVNLNPVTGNVGLHRVVQAVARTADPSDPHRRAEDISAAQNNAIGLLAGLVPPPDAPAAYAAASWRTLLPHIDAFADYSDGQPVTAETITIMDRAFGFLEEQGNPAAGIRMAACSLAGEQEQHGPDHPDTLTSRANLAHACYAAGDLGRAIQLHEQTLDDSLRVLGPDHPDTLRFRNNLASVYESAGDLGHAIPLFEQTLEDFLRVLGPDHPDTLRSRNNLAGGFSSAGDLERATPLYEQALADRLRVLGEDHPDTLTSRNDLAHAYSTAGDLRRAIPLYEKTLEDSLRILGPDHPYTLTYRNSLAYGYRAAGNLGRAIPLYEQNLDERTRILGPDHPDTLRSRNNLAYALSSAGDLPRAIPLFEQTLADRLRVLGKDHPETLRSRSNLAGAYESAGHLGQAIQMFERNLDDALRILGPDHPDTLRFRTNLATARAGNDLRESGESSAHGESCSR